MGLMSHEQQDNLFYNFESFTKACLINPYGGTKLSKDLKEIFVGEDLDLSEKEQTAFKD